jgi:murein DD-endopeptidase MepM/ murein hydrolase activator NlpD
MGKKFLSLIIIPHNKAGYRTLSFSRKTIRTVKWGGIALGVILLLLAADYVRIQVNGHSYRNLAAENAKQREQLSLYESSIGILQKRIQDFDSYVKKLNLMAGIKSPDILKEVGIGGGGYEPAGGNGQGLPGTPPIQSPNAIKGLQEKAVDIHNNLNALADFFQSQEARLASTPTIYPTVGLLTSAFGWRADPFTGKQTFHYGLDIAAAYGNPIVATADGIVIAMNTDKMMGQSVQISHGLGITTVYGHMSKFVVTRIGQKIKRGDILGEVGSTGKALGPHVHYEVRVNGTAVNPYFYILEE